mmetsp:Transcript_15521/g.38452  ORF Transcript_15521/g.38452 Transcript_15521/m.38452 type:complete len:167 (+) Transcript_15521:256-756(+)|eukprot:g5834.t1
MEDKDVDWLDDIQGRWQTSEQDILVIEADQVYFIGDTDLYGHIQAEMLPDGRLHITFSTQNDAGQEESVGGSYTVDGDLTTIIWADGDVWKKLVPGEVADENGNTGNRPVIRAKSESVSVASATGKTIGRLNSGLAFELDEDGQARRWTKNGQLGSNAEFEKVEEE